MPRHAASRQLPSRDAGHELIPPHWPQGYTVVGQLARAVFKSATVRFAKAVLALSGHQCLAR